MKKSIGLWSLWGFAITVLGGTLLHFLYDWTGESRYFAAISAVNESTWEHMKLFFVPTFIFAIVQSIFFGDSQNFWCIKLRIMLIGLALIPIIFYTYNGVIGKSPDWINITIFFIAAAVSYIYEWLNLYSDKITCHHPKLALIGLIVLALLFVLFTYRTPTLNVFKDPITNTYGI